jgi:hypothetical protein
VRFEVCGLSTGIDRQAAEFPKTGNSALPIVQCCWCAATKEHRDALVVGCHTLEFLERCQTIGLALRSTKPRTEGRVWAAPTVAGFLLDKPIPRAREFCLVSLTPAPGMTLAFGSQSNGSSRTRRSVKERRLSRISLSAALAAVACASLASMTPAQDEETGILSQANQQWPKPMFAALPPRYLENLLTPSSPTVTYSRPERLYTASVWLELIPRRPIHQQP